MIDVDKLNNAIEDLENQVLNINKISQLVNQIDEISKSVRINEESYNDVISKLGYVKKEFEKLIVQHNTATSNNRKIIEDLNDEVSSKLIEFDDKNSKFYDNLSSLNKEIKSELIDTSNKLDLRMEKTLVELGENKDALDLKLDSNYKILKYDLIKEIQRMRKDTNDIILKSEEGIINNIEASSSKQKITIIDVTKELDQKFTSEISELENELLIKLDNITSTQEKALEIINENINKKISRLNHLVIIVIVLLATGLIKLFI